VRRALHRIDPELAVSSPRPMTDAVSDTVAPRRFEATVLVSFAGVSLLLAGVGVYAVLALAVTDRTRELGVRAALGAAPFVLRRLVMRNALGTVAIGISAGIPAALATAVAARSLLFGVEPQDPTMLAGGALIVTLVALLASYLPARRAARVDPMVALKTE
jgi:ABC-type antimicrobial peptide transport system permease subunit